MNSNFLNKTKIVTDLSFSKKSLKSLNLERIESVIQGALPVYYYKLVCIQGVFKEQGDFCFSANFFLLCF